jgi:hypothetical protein
MRQRMVDYHDFVMQDIRIGRIEMNAFLDD